MLKSKIFAVCFCAISVLCLCACSAVPSKADSHLLPVIDPDAIQTAAVSATPSPVQTSAPSETPAPQAIECNAYVEGQVLMHRAYVDIQSGALMVPLYDFAACLGITVENDAASVTLRQDDPSIFVHIDDIYDVSTACAINGEVGALYMPFTSVNGTVFAPLDSLSDWFKLEWLQNPLGDVMIARIVEEPLVIEEPTEETETAAP